MKSLRQSIRESLGRRLSLRGSAEMDSLSKEIVKYTGISLAALAKVRDGVLEGTEAPEVELYILVEDVEDVKAGQTVKLTGRKGLQDDVFLVRVPFRKRGLVVGSSSVRLKQRREWTIEDVCEFIILPNTRRDDSFYLDLVGKNSIGKPFQGAFVSQARRSSFCGLVDALQVQYQGQDPKRVYLWLDIFCANQPLLACNDHTTDPQVQQERWKLLNTGLHQAIKNFDERVIFFNAWDDPYPLQRAWCIWEIYGAAVSGKPLEIIFDPSASQDLLGKLLESPEHLLKAIAHLDPRKMQCHDQKDLDMIRQAVEQLPGGFSSLKARITEQMRRWLISTVEDAIQARRERSESSQDESFAALLKHAARFMRVVDAKDKALEYISQAKDIYVSIYKTERHHVIGALFSKIADMYRYQGKYELAQEMFEKALDIMEETQDEEDEETAGVCTDLAGVYDVLGKYDKALPLHLRALRIFKESCGEHNRKTANAFNNTGLVYYNMGEYGMAVEMYEKAMEIFRHVSGERHPDTAGVYGNLAEVYRKLGKYELALEMLEKVLEIMKETLGENHPVMAGSWGNIGLIYFNMGDYDTAMEMYEKSMEVFKKAFGERHPAIGVTFNNMGDVCHAQGDFEAAEEMYERALDVKKEVFGQRHPSTAITEFNLGLLFEKQGKLLEARDKFALALSIRKELLGPTHPLTLEVQSCSDKYAE